MVQRSINSSSARAGGSADSYILERVWYDPILIAEAQGPVASSVVDSLGRRTGFDPATRTSVFEIPDSTYSGVSSSPQSVGIYTPHDNYTIQLLGTADGSFNLELVNLAIGYKFRETFSTKVRFNETRKYIVRVNANGSMSIFNCAADLNDDLMVDIYDALILSGAFNSKLGDPEWNIKADINRDDSVDVYDAILLANNYGKAA